MSVFRSKSLFSMSRSLLSMAVLGAGTAGCDKLVHQRDVPQPATMVASASLPAVVPLDPARSTSTPLILEKMPDEAVTHRFAKNTPAAAPAFFETVQPDGSHLWRMRPVNGVAVTREEEARVAREQMARARAYLETPMSLVSRTKPTALYSREINRPLCVARAGAKEWIGTEIGIKCVDREREIVRIFAGVDGLPLGRVEQIATDDSGDAAVALVRRGENRPGATSNHRADWKPDQVAVCLYDAKNGRWKELAALPLTELKRDGLPFEAANRLGNDQRISYRVVLTANHVVVAPSVARTDSETAFAVYDRATGKAQGNAWEETLKADHPVVFVNAITRQGNSVLFGTNIGLLIYDVATTRWRRALPTQEIHQVIVGEGNDAPVFAVGTARGLGNGHHAPADFRLLRMSLRTTKADDPPGSLPVNRQGDGVLTAAPNGMLWLTYPDCFYKSSSNGADWVRTNDEGEAVAGGNILPPNHHDFGNDWDPFYVRSIRPVASESQIPDAAAIARILMVRDTPSFAWNGESVRARELMLWMRQRFARWLSPRSEKAESVTIDPMGLPMTSRPPKDPVWGFIPDPNDSNMAFGLQGTTLLHLPKTEVPQKELPPSGNNRALIRQYKPLSPGAKNVMKYPLYDASTATVTEGVVATPFSLLPDTATDDSLYIVTANGVRRYDGVKDTWTDLSVGGDNFRAGMGNDLSYAGKDRTPILAAPALTRLNATGDRFEPIPAAEGARGHHLSRGGFWMGVSDRLVGGGGISGSPISFRFRPMGEDGAPRGEWQTFNSESDLPALREKQHNKNCVVTGTVAWFRYATGERGASATVAGYDAQTKRWLAPVTTPAYGVSTDIYVTETPDGGALIGIPEALVSVLRYHPGADSWEPVVSEALPNAKNSDGFRPFLAPEGTVYAVTPAELCEYDARRKQWLRFVLPASLTDPISHTTNLYPLRLGVTRKAVYIGSQERGLWRMDRSSKGWKPVREPLRWSPDAKEAGRYHIGKIAADKNGVWASGGGGRVGVPVLLRWDRRTKAARFLSEKDTGLPFDPVDSFNVVGTANGALLWRNIGRGIYRAEPGKTRFTRISPDQPESFQTAPDKSGTLFLVSRLLLYQYDEKKGRLITLDPKLPYIQPRGDTGYPIQRGLTGGLVVTESAVYVGSGAGAYRYDRKNGAWSLVPRTENIWVQGMHRDGDTLVISTDKTTARFSLR